MTDITVKNLTPAPYFARFLEGQKIRIMSDQEMRTVQGGHYVTAAYPSDTDAPDLPMQPSMRLGNLEQEIGNKLRAALDGNMQIPGSPQPEWYPCEYVTQAYPSDSDDVGR